MIHSQGARMVNRMADESNMGMSMGIFSFGGILTPVLGMLGDIYGLQIVFCVLTALSVIQIFISYIVPRK